MRNNFFKNLSYLTLIQISNTLIPLLIIPYISRIIGVDNFGNLEYSRVFCYYFTIFINYGFDLTITREISLNRENPQMIRKLVNQTIFAKFFLLFISTIGFFILLGEYEGIKSIKLLLILTFLINIGYVLYPIWFFQGIEKMAKISIVSFFSKLIVALFTILLIVKESDYWLYNFFQSLAMIGVGIYALYIVYIKYNIKFEKPDINFIKRVLKQGFPVFIGTILVTIITSLFFIFLKDYSNTTELAKFSTSNKLIASIQLMILLPFSQAFFPLINNKFAESKEKFIEYINLAAMTLFVITLLQGIITILFPELIITVIFGKEFTVAKESLQILAFLPMFASLMNVYGYQGLLTLKKDKIFLYVHIFFALLCIVINIIYINNYNTLTASYIRIGIEILMFITCFVLFNYYIKKWKKS